VNRQRVLLAACLLERGNDTIASVSAHSGFGSPDTLRRHFVRRGESHQTNTAGPSASPNPTPAVQDGPGIRKDTMAVPSIAHSADVLNSRRQRVPVTPAWRRLPDTLAIEAWSRLLWRSMLPAGADTAKTQDATSNWPKASAFNRLAREG
jgi:hypothetical protein